MVEGFPEPAVHWKHNGNVVTQNECIIIEKKKNEHILKILGIDEKSAGVYTVLATNDVDKVEAICDVVIEFSPFFVKELKTQDFLENSSCSIEVNVQGFPQPKLEWFKDDEPLSVSENVSVKDFSLHFEKFHKGDVGKYKVLATNASGMAKSEAELHILGKHVESFFTLWTCPNHKHLESHLVGPNYQMFPHEIIHHDVINNINRVSKSLFKRPLPNYLGKKVDIQ